MWQSIQYVSSGLTLVAFITAVAAWLYRQSSLKTERLIKTAPDEERAKLVRATLEFFDVDTAKLTKEQQFNLALTQVHARARRFLVAALVVALLAVLAAIVAGVAIANDSDKKAMRQKLDSIDHTQAQLAHMVREVEHAAGKAEEMGRHNPEVDRLANQLNALLTDFDRSYRNVALSEDDASRLKGARETLADAVIIFAQLTFAFSDYEDGDGIPPGPLFPQDCVLEIAAKRRSQPNGQPRAGWKNGILMESPDVLFSSNVQSIDRQTDQTVDGTTARQISTFTNFQGERRTFADPAVWKNADFEAVLRTKYYDPWLQRHSGQPDVAHFDKFYGISTDQRQTWADSDVSVQPVLSATLAVFVNGEKVTTLRGIVARVSEHDEDARHLHVARFIPQVTP